MIPKTNLTSRFLLKASPVLFAPRWATALTGSDPIVWWRLADGTERTMESVSGSEDEIASRTGRARWGGDDHDRALRLDGYSTWVSYPEQSMSLRSRSITVSAWLALESYPVDEAAIVDWRNDPETRCRFSIDDDF